jgi:Mg2+-importing ATPase
MNASFWHLPSETVLKDLRSSASDGLGSSQAARSLARRKLNERIRPEWWQAFLLFVRQFSSPLVLLLAFAALMSSVMGNWSDSFILLTILLFTGMIGFWQEYRAGKAVEKLRNLMQVHCTVIRDGKPVKIVSNEVVPGDIIIFSAGDIVPADCLMLEATDLHVNESVLTGESFPVEKEPGQVAEDTPVNRRTNTLFEGTSIMSGTARAVAVCTGPESEIGQISQELSQGEPESAFQTGIRSFGYLLLRLTFMLSAGMLIFNLLLGKPIISSILFSIALAVGLAPELLPAIMIATLSAGAIRMAKSKVIVKKLEAIQNLGAVEILCSDKTGTLTTGEARVAGTIGIHGSHSDRVRLLAWLNASFESGFTNPMDEAIRKLTGMPSLNTYIKKDEVPYDFQRKRLSIVVKTGQEEWMVTKGALSGILEVCNFAETEEGKVESMGPDIRASILQQFEQQSASGFRIIGVAWKNVTGDPVINRDDENDMIFSGFLLLEDPPKPGVARSIHQLEELGVTLKIITGDNRLAAKHLAVEIGISCEGMMTGEEIQQLSDQALARKARHCHLFAEIDPQQKERLIRALRSGGKVVGYLGDGINDAPALKAADVGVSVDTAVDVAKAAADIVLLEKKLEVLHQGILDGRKTYLNTLKYIFITTSANFGNMFSLSGISLFLRWMPLLPVQILLINLLSDIPALTIASDRVDEEQLKSPKKWDIKLIRRFMIWFGIQSSVFDYLTFGCLLWIFHTGEKQFQTGWFVESVLTEIVVLLLIRTYRPVFKSRPSGWLLATSLFTATATLLLPYVAPGALFGLEPLPVRLLLFLLSITFLYAVLVEFSKQRFFRQAGY